MIQQGITILDLSVTIDILLYDLSTLSRCSLLRYGLLQNRVDEFVNYDHMSLSLVSPKLCERPVEAPA